MAKIDKIYDELKDYKHIGLSDEHYQELVDLLNNNRIVELFNLSLSQKKLLPLSLIRDNIALKIPKSATDSLLISLYSIKDCLRLYTNFLTQKYIYKPEDLEKEGVPFKEWAPSFLPTPIWHSMNTFINSRVNEVETVKLFNSLLPDELKSQKVSEKNKEADFLKAFVLSLMYKRTTVIRFLKSREYQIYTKKIKDLSEDYVQGIANLPSQPEMHVLLIAHLIGLPDNLDY